jgi:hypothetical protein
MKAATAMIAAVGALAAPAAADAATLAVAPVKPCYRAGQQVGIGGAGYTPNDSVQVNVDGRVLSTVGTDGSGNFGGLLTLGDPSGERLKTYTGIDTANNANQASVQVRVSSLLVTVTPKSGRAGRSLRVRARGFTTGKTLYAHIVRGKSKRNMRIGRLKGACRKLSVRKRIFSSRTRSGTYTVQFDTRRHYSKKTAVRYRFSVPVFRTASHAAAAQTWTPG